MSLTNAQIKSDLENHVNYVLASKGEPFILCEDGTVLNKQGQRVLPNDDAGASYRAYLYKQFAARGAARPALMYSLGKPAVSDDDKIVASTNMKVGDYTLTGTPNPDVPRNVIVTATAVGAADTAGTITIEGTDAQGNVITEVITPVAGSAVTGTKAFKTVTKVTGAGWVISEGNDTIKVGYENELGLPFAVETAEDIQLGILGTTITAHNPTVTTPASVSGTTIDMSAGTYNGTKEAFVFVS
ncbi:MAG: hypothetical protein ACOYU3_07295 [Bacillota bacterium]